MPGFMHSVETFFAKMYQLIILLTQHLSEHLRVPIDVLEDCFPDDGQFSSVLWHYSPFQFIDSEPNRIANAES
jgi:hypothetical protein